MKQILYLALSALIFVGCKSREEKVSELIKTDMFKTLYDFESYEPIETQIDSAFTSIYTDTIALTYASSAKDIFDELDEAESEYNDAKSALEIWSDNYSSLGRQKSAEARVKIERYISQIDKGLENTKILYGKIKDRNTNIQPDFIGWEAKHRFRCKTKGGNFDLGNYLYVIDKDFSSIIYMEDLDNKRNNRLKTIIKEALESKEEKSEDINTVPDESQSVADSLARVLKGGI